MIHLKKTVLILILSLVVLLIALSVFLLVRFVALAEKTDDASAPLPSVEAYARETYPEFSCRLDGDCLTLSKSTQMAYDTACSVGASVFCDELAPETYLAQLHAIRADLLSSCEVDALTVRLAYLSSEGETIWSIDTSGSVFTCWKEY